MGRINLHSLDDSGEPAVVRRGKARPQLELVKKETAAHMSLLILGIVVVRLHRCKLSHEEAFHREERLVQARGDELSSENGGDFTVVDP